MHHRSTTYSQLSNSNAGRNPTQTADPSQPTDQPISRCTSSEGAKECSPPRKRWEGNRESASPKGAKENNAAPQPDPQCFSVAKDLKQSARSAEKKLEDMEVPKNSAHSAPSALKALKKSAKSARSAE